MLDCLVNCKLRDTEQGFHGYKTRMSVAMGKVGGSGVLTLRLAG